MKYRQVLGAMSILYGPIFPRMEHPDTKQIVEMSPMPAVTRPKIPAQRLISIKFLLGSSFGFVRLGEFISSACN